MAGPAGTLAPSPKFVGSDDAGNPIAGGKVYSYYAGTSTPAPTFNDADLDPSHTNANPVVLDSAGRATIYLQPGVSYKFLFKTSADVQIWSQDNIAAVSPLQTGIDTLGTAGEALAAGQVVYLSDGTGGAVAGRWYKADSATATKSTLPTIGMVTSAIIVGQLGSIRMVGAVTGLSGLVPGANYYVGTAGALTGVSPVFSRLVGVADSATSLVMCANPAATASTITPAALVVTTVGTIPILPLPAGRGDLYVYMNNATPATIQGISFANVVPYQRVTIIAHNAQVNLQHLAPGAGQNGLFNFANSAPMSIIGLPGQLSGGSATYQFDASLVGLWRMIAHEQGAWITAPFSAANFSSTGGSWTVTAGQASTLKYRLSGRSMTMTFQVNGSTIAGTPSNLAILNGAYGGFTAVNEATGVIYVAESATGVPGLIQSHGGGAFLGLTKLSGALAATAASYVQGTFTFEVN